MNKELQALTEQRHAESVRVRQAVLEAWNPTIERAEQFFSKETGKSWTPWMKQQIAQVLENSVLDSTTRGVRRVLSETTSGDGVDFLGVQLPIVMALLPSSVLSEVMVIQALERRTGSVFFANINAGQAKGSIAAGATLVSSKTGITNTAPYTQYPTEFVTNEGQGTGTSGTLAYTSVVRGSLLLVRGTEVMTDAGDGTLTSSESSGGTGTINYDTGEWTVTDWIGTGTILASYTYNFDKISNGVPEIDLGMSSEAITARDFPLRAKFSISAAIDFEKAHGQNLESLLSKWCGEYVKFAVDRYGIQLIVNAAEAGGATSPGTFSAVPGSGQEFVFRAYELNRYIEQGSNNITEATLRGQASYIIAGNNVATVIKALSDRGFKRAGDLNSGMITGPRVIGTLDGRTVIQDPLVNKNKYYLGWKGDEIVNASSVWCPYVPFYTTPTVTLSDLIAQKGFYSASGFKVVNSKLLCAADISGI